MSGITPTEIYKEMRSLNLLTWDAISTSGATDVRTLRAVLLHIIEPEYDVLVEICCLMAVPHFVERRVLH
jgi:hypothetical protein